MFKFKLPRLLAAVAIVISLGNANAYSGLVVFGDSLVDGGNNALVVGTVPGTVITGDTYYSRIPYTSLTGLGTYSNGPVWTQYLAQSLGVPLTPSLAGGSNYAFGGALTGANGNDVPQVPGFPFGMAAQVGMFAANNPGGADPNALYIVAGGGNNLRLALDQIAGGADANATVFNTIQGYAAEMGFLVDSLQAMGAQHILVVNTPNFGLTPLANAMGISGMTTLLSGGMNQALATRMSGEAGVMSFDLFAYQTGIVSQGAASGFSDLSRACGAASNACDPSTALYFDAIHPSTLAHQRISQAVLATAVPEPSTYGLMALGLALIGLASRRQVRH